MKGTQNLGNILQFGCGLRGVAAYHLKILSDWDSGSTFERVRIQNLCYSAGIGCGGEPCS